jgi:NCAIR mutase (PurE)-related protein
MDTFNIDHQRHDRLGFPEIIFGATKPAPIIKDILTAYQERGENAMVTKLQEDKARWLSKHFPEAFYDELSGAFMLHPIDEASLQTTPIGVLAAGTSDIYIVNEIFYTLAFLGLKAERVIDIGVAGLHRLVSRLEDLKKFKVLIVVAGFEGALPTVVAGLLPQPVIAVPANVGYGVAAGGQAALSSMLASCANGITVVNIDNGYGAAMAAFRIVNHHP